MESRKMVLMTYLQGSGNADREQTRDPAGEGEGGRMGRGAWKHVHNHT